MEPMSNLIILTSIRESEDTNHRVGHREFLRFLGESALDPLVEFAERDWTDGVASLCTASSNDTDGRDIPVGNRVALRSSSLNDSEMEG